jgi:hypothetical protein
MFPYILAQLFINLKLLTYISNVIDPRLYVVPVDIFKLQDDLTLTQATPSFRNFYARDKNQEKVGPPLAVS